MSYCSISKLAFATRGVCPNRSFWRRCCCLSFIQTTTDAHMGAWQTLAPRHTQHLRLVLFSTTRGLCQIMGSTFQSFSFTSLYIVYVVCQSTDFVMAAMLLKETAWERVLLYAYAALFMFSFYPAIHHSSVPWFKLWGTLSELMHWSELGQVWNMNWLHVWVWLRVWCFSLLARLLFFLFRALSLFPLLVSPHLGSASLHSLQLLYRACAWVQLSHIYPPSLLFNSVSHILFFFFLFFFWPSSLSTTFSLTTSAFRRSQFPMNCWLDSLVTRRPSAQWLPSSHADANSTVQSDCASRCHRPGERVLGMPGRVIPPACAFSAVSLVRSTVKMSK